MRVTLLAVVAFSLSAAAQDKRIDELIEKLASVDSKSASDAEQHLIKLGADALPRLKVALEQHENLLVWDRAGGVMDVIGRKLIERACASMLKASSLTCVIKEEWTRSSPKWDRFAEKRLAFQAPDTVVQETTTGLVSKKFYHAHVLYRVGNRGVYGIKGEFGENDENLKCSYRYTPIESSGYPLPPIPTAFFELLPRCLLRTERIRVVSQDTKTLVLEAPINEKITDDELVLRNGYTLGWDKAMVEYKSGRAIVTLSADAERIERVEFRITTEDFVVEGCSERRNQSLGCDTKIWSVGFSQVNETNVLPLPAKVTKILERHKK